MRWQFLCDFGGVHDVIFTAKHECFILSLIELPISKLYLTDAIRANAVKISEDSTEIKPCCTNPSHYLTALVKKHLAVH